MQGQFESFMARVIYFVVEKYPLMRQKTRHMEKLSTELEQKVKVLVKQNKIAEAVLLVQTELKLGLKISKDLVDRYR